MPKVIIIGGGLAGSEAAWQAAQRGIDVILYEMRPFLQTGAHQGVNLAELVCSNSLGSRRIFRAPGLIKEEIRVLGSLLLTCAEQTGIPAGDALAVDREAFSQAVTEKIESHPNIRIVRQEVTEIPKSPAIIASGPLTSTKLASAISNLTGQEHLFFYDAVAPIISVDSINFEIAFHASRYGRGEKERGDYINCPMQRKEYETFVDELINAERIELKSFDEDFQNGVKAGAHKFFEGCLPVEILARRGREALAFGPLRPVGLVDPRTGDRPYAIAQLRQDNLAGSLFNLVGFQTNLKYSEQERVFRMIPGLEAAEFVRLGQMHRNTFINSPRLLKPAMQFRGREDIFFAGQITGVEGYVSNIATGLLSGLNAARYLKGESLIELPRESMLGSMIYFITHAGPLDFQPVKANFGILPALEGKKLKGKRQRGEAYSRRALKSLENYLESIKYDAHSHLLCRIK